MEDFFPFKEIEEKWHRRWEELFTCDVDKSDGKHYRAGKSGGVLDG